MKKIMVLTLALVCMLGLDSCGRQEQPLNYKDLASVIKQSETLSVSKSDFDGEYITEGHQLAEFLDEASWTAQTGFARKVQRYTEQNSKVSIQIKLDGIYLKIFDTDTAIIYDESVGKETYYRMSDGDYEKILGMVSLETNQ